VTPRRPSGATSPHLATPETEAGLHVTARSTLLGTFRRFAHAVAHATGSPLAFVAAVVTIVAWAVTGPIFHFSDTWQLVINTGTTIITFLMVFLIQNTQNRDSQVVQLKLNELIRAVHSARNDLVDLEELSDEELHRLQEHFAAFHRRAVDVRARRGHHESPGARGSSGSPGRT
jgi:low affinity Fe/Cu permease